MELEIVTDPDIIARLEAERKKSEIGPHTNLLMNRFAGMHYQELGGSVRDVIINELYGTPFTVRDWDLIIDDSQEDIDLFVCCEGLPGYVGKNHFGNVKWRVAPYEFDITKYSSRRDKSGPATLEGFFHGCDFNIGTIAYCREHAEILSLAALSGIRTKTISLMNPETDRPHATITRAINFERRLGFRLDEETLRYIRETYTPAMDPAIANYMRERGMGDDTYRSVIKRLGEIVSKETAA